MAFPSAWQGAGRGLTRRDARARARLLLSDALPLAFPPRMAGRRARLTRHLGKGSCPTKGGQALCPSGAGAERAPVCCASICFLSLTTLMHCNYSSLTTLMHCNYSFDDSDALLFIEPNKMVIPRVYACVCTHIREGFISFALVCKYLGRFRLEIRRRYYRTAFFPSKDFRFEV